MSMIGKSWRLLATPFFWVALGVAWALFALYMLMVLQEYLAISPMLAGLENQPGATHMLLGQGARAVQWLMVLWSVFFVPRLFAGERQWLTYHLRRTSLARRSIGWWSHVAVAGLALLLLALPFWVFVAGLSPVVQWDGGLLAAYAFMQIFFAAYAVGLAAMLSIWPRQMLTASLLVGLVWLVLWLLPVLTSSPEWLVALLQWFSPFSHQALLMDGLVSVQSVVFWGLHMIFFATWLDIGWSKRG